MAQGNDRINTQKCLFEAYEIYDIRGVYEDFAIRGWRYLFDARFITSKEKIRRKGRHSR